MSCSNRKRKNHIQGGVGIGRRHHTVKKKGEVTLDEA